MVMQWSLGLGPGWPVLPGASAVAGAPSPASSCQPALCPPVPSLLSQSMGKMSCPWSFLISDKVKAVMGVIISFRRGQ